METTNRKIKAGPFTLALGLIALGIGALAGNFGLTEVGSMLKLWPLLLIGLGLEYFIRKLTSGDNEVQFSIPGAFLVGVMALTMWSANALYKMAPVDFMEELLSNHGTEHVRNWQGNPLELAGSQLEIENRIGTIEITPSPDQRLHVSARITGSGATGEKARASAESAKIFVEPGPVTRVYTGSQDEHSRRSANVKLKVEIPAGLNVSASNKMGNVLVQKTSAKYLSLEALAGGIEVDEYTGDLKAENKMGEINLKNINGNSEVEGMAGRISIINPRGEVTAVSRNGSIDLASSLPLDKKYDLKTSNGEITLRLPRSSSLKARASNSNGGISGMENYVNEGGQTRGVLALGDGKGSALLETKNGHIKVDVTD